MYFHHTCMVAALQQTGLVTAAGAWGFIHQHHVAWEQLSCLVGQCAPPGGSPGVCQQACCLWLELPGIHHLQLMLPSGMLDHAGAPCLEAADFPGPVTVLRPPHCSRAALCGLPSGAVAAAAVLGRGRQGAVAMSNAVRAAVDEINHVRPRSQSGMYRTSGCRAHAA